MRISSCAHLVTLAAIVLSSNLAFAEPPPCPPGAYCEELPSETPAEPELEEPEEVEVPEPDVEPPPDEPAPPVHLASEYDDWGPDDGYEQRPEPTYSNAVEEVGLGMFAVTYGIPFFIGLVAVAAVDENPDVAPLIPLLVPIGGPLITGAIYEVGEEGYALLGAAGGMQAVGLIIWAIGASLPDDPQDTASVRPTPNGLMVRF